MSQSKSLQTNSLTFVPSDDATIREGSPTKNYGAETDLWCDADTLKDMLLRFEIAGIGSEAVESATLRLFATDSSPFGGAFTQVTDTTWSEATVTWDSAPPGDGWFLGSLGAVTAGNWYEMDVTLLVSGDGPVSLRINCTSANGADYASKEDAGGLGPQLVVVLGDPQNPDTTPPTAPANLAIGNISTSSLTLSWDGSADNVGVVGYNVVRDGSLLATVGSVTTYQDTSFTLDTNHQYTVHARDAAGNLSASSTTVEVTVPSPDTTPPSAPGNLTTTSILATSISMQWFASSDDVAVVGYEVYRNGNLLATLGPVTSYQDGAVLPATSYQYEVRARDAAGNVSAPSNAVAVTTLPSPQATFVFGAAGDHSGSSTTGAALDLLMSSGAEFYLALGDLSYSSISPESAWCDFVHQHVGESYPFQIVTGNHEDRIGDDGHIDNFAACMPDRLGVLDLYPYRYYFDYPNANPLARFILIDPDLYRGSSRVQFCKDGETTECDWLAARIDEAHNAGLWVIVGMHKNCITMGVKPCEISSELLDLLAEKKVDLVLQGHEHNYQRSKQLSLGAACSTIAVDAYNSACVVDDGADGVYTKGQGSVVVISGAFGTSLTSLDDSDPEAAYFASTMDKNNNPSNGFVRYGVSESAIFAQYMTPNGNFSESFSIVESPSEGDTSPPTAPGNPSATAAHAEAVTVSWDAGSDDVGVVGYDLYRDGTLLAAIGAVLSYQDTSVLPETTYQYEVRARDAAGNISGPSDPVVVTTPIPNSVHTFTPTDDASVRESSPGTNYGSESRLEVDASSPKDTLLTFDVSGVGAAEVIRALLRLYATNGSSVGGEFYAVTDTSWSEDTVTWNTAPPGDGGLVGVLGSVTSGQWYEVDVTSIVSGDGLVSIRISSTSPNGVDYDSKEDSSGFAPELVVETAAGGTSGANLSPETDGGHESEGQDPEGDGVSTGAFRMYLPTIVR